MHTIIITILLTIATIGAMAQEVTQSYEQIDKVTASIEELETALEKDPESEKANYNLATYYYNQGVEVIEKMDFDADYDANYKSQEEVQRLFENALPYAETAHELNPKESKTLSMLSGIHFGLNNMDRKDYYDNLLSQLD